MRTHETFMGALFCADERKMLFMEKQRRVSTKKLVVLALMSALGFLAMMLMKIPVVMFLKYEPKDIFIVLTGFLYGPLSALAVAVVTALLELPFSDTGLIGLVMNVLSSASFACVASFIYHKRRDVFGAAAGLLSGMAAMTVSMLLWNYLISPLYMGVTRAEIVPMLTAVFLPFNLLKSGINASIVMLLYRPFLRVLEQVGLARASEKAAVKQSTRVWVTVVSAAILIVCIGIVVLLNR